MSGFHKAILALVCIFILLLVIDELMLKRYVLVANSEGLYRYDRLTGDVCWTKYNLHLQKGSTGAFGWVCGSFEDMNNPQQAVSKPSPYDTFLEGK